MKDVNNLLDIPELEHHIDKDFDLVGFIKGDSTQLWEFEQAMEKFITIEIISDEDTILSCTSLADLINQKNIGYFQIAYYPEYNCGYDMTIAQDVYCYRPLISQDEKVY